MRQAEERKKRLAEEQRRAAEKAALEQKKAADKAAREKQVCRTHLLSFYEL